MGATLDYYSMRNWTSLALWMERNKPESMDTETMQQFVADIVQHAQETGFYLRTGDRAGHLASVLAQVMQIDQWNPIITTAFAWDWLPDTSKPKPDLYYVMVKRVGEEDWSYLRVGDQLGDRLNGFGQYGLSYFALSWNGIYTEGSTNDGAIYCSPSRSDCQNVKELALKAPAYYSAVKISGKAPE